MVGESSYRHENGRCPSASYGHGRKIVGVNSSDIVAYVDGHLNGVVGSWITHWKVHSKLARRRETDGNSTSVQRAGHYQQRGKVKWKHSRIPIEEQQSYRKRRNR